MAAVGHRGHGGFFALVPVTALSFAAGGDKSRGESELTRRSFIAQADLLRPGFPVFSDNAPDPLKLPQYPSQDDLVRWSKDGQLQPLPLSAEDRATASAFFSSGLPQHPPGLGSAESMSPTSMTPRHPFWCQSRHAIPSAWFW